MTDGDLQLLIDFRAEVAEPDEETARRIYARVTAPTAPRRRRVPRFRPPDARRLLRPSLLSAAVVVAAAAAIVLVAPWQRSHGTLADLALAAIGSQPVVHVVSEMPTGGGLVDIATGTTTPLVQRDEIWYDASRGLRRDLTTIGSTVVDDVLETPQGGFTPRGIVYDCTWIAAHPIAATKARVSCNPSGKNGTTPHVVPRLKPTLNPGLAGFADSYRAALASGQAREAGTGTVDGQKVDWLEFPTSGSVTEKVALDPVSHKPLFLRTEGSTTKIAQIETIAYDASDFARPRPSEVPEQPSATRADDLVAIALDGAAISNGYPGAVWAGAHVAGLPLVRAATQTLTVSFADTTPSRHGRGLDLAYGTLDANGRLDRSQPFIDIQEAPSPTLATMQSFIHGGYPSAGTLYADPLLGAARTSDTLSVGGTVVDGVYITIQTYATPPATLLEVARALTRP
jgi:hypothetical protein